MKKAVQAATKPEENPSESSRRQRSTALLSPAGQARPGFTLRAVAVVMHRYVGLAMAVFLILAGLTGSALAFYHELEAALSPTMLRAQAPAADSRPMDPLELREALQAKLPAGAQINYLLLDHKPGQASRFYVDASRVVEGSTDDEYYVNPYTGEILGSRLWGDLAQGTKNLMPFVYRLHFSLALDKVGMYLLGIVALLWTLDCFVGAYLTFPRRGRVTAPNRKSWFLRWQPSWLLRTTKLFSLVFTWHRASGLWVWGMLLVFAWSAVGLNLREEVYSPVMKATFGMQPRAYDSLPALAQPRPNPALSWHEAREAGRALMAQQAGTQRFEVFEERMMSYEEARGAYRYRARSSLDVSDRYPSTTIWLDGNTGKLVAFDAPTGQDTGSTITTWLHNLHFASIAIGGLPYRIFVCLMGLAVSLLSITGVWIWWRKRRRRKAKHVRNCAASHPYRS